MESRNIWHTMSQFAIQNTLYNIALYLDSAQFLGSIS